MNFAILNIYISNNLFNFGHFRHFDIKTLVHKQIKLLSSFKICFYLLSYLRRNKFKDKLHLGIKQVIIALTQQDKNDQICKNEKHMV